RPQERAALVERGAQRRLGRIGERLVLRGQYRDDRLDDAAERRAQLARHLLDEVVLQPLDLPELLVRAQQLDVLGEERLGELQPLLALLLVALVRRAVRAQRLALLCHALVIESQRQQFGQLGDGAGAGGIERARRTDRQ